MMPRVMPSNPLSRSWRADAALQSDLSGKVYVVSRSVLSAWLTGKPVYRIHEWFSKTLD